MKSAQPQRVRDVVYVVGAGFSAGLGYPLTKDLLDQVRKRLDQSAQQRLDKVIRFHHPAFDPANAASFPNIEQLLTELSVNLELFDASRPIEGNFKRRALEASKDSLLWTMAQWFHDLYAAAQSRRWLAAFRERVNADNAAIVSFNWDLVLDHLLFESGIDASCYGLEDKLGLGPLLLKPHGSLNWYNSRDVKHVAKSQRVAIFDDQRPGERVEAFRSPRPIRSKVGKRYNPLLVPPTYLKDFKRPIFQRLWNNCTNVLSTPKTLIFLGYSLPSADLHAQFIFRCGFHNQFEGRLKPTRGRFKPTGPANVVIVNPDEGAATRIREVAGPGVDCEWICSTVEDWMAATA